MKKIKPTEALILSILQNSPRGLYPLQLEAEMEEVGAWEFRSPKNRQRSISDAVKGSSFVEKDRSGRYALTIRGEQVVVNKDKALYAMRCRLPSWEQVPDDPFRRK